MENKWEGFKVRGCRIENLGRPAVFLIPSHKMRVKMGDQAVEEALHEFLAQKYGAFTTTLLPLFGFWQNGKKEIDYDECRQYEVSFPGKEHIPPLIEFLAKICQAIGEDCLYFKAGQYACTIWPD